MAYSSGFFNSINGDRKYNAEELSNFYGQLISNGVLNKAGNGLQVTAGEGLTVKISKGWAWINTHYFYNDSVITLDVPQSGAVSKVYNIVLRLNNTQQSDGRYIKPFVSETIVRQDLIYDIVLAKVFVSANSVAISNANITDTRPNTNLCGWVTGLINQVDTTELDNQWRSAYQNFYDRYMAWFSDLTETLGISTYNNRIEVSAISTQNQDTFKPNISTYETTDILDVYINGIRLIPNLEYTIKGAGADLIVSFKNNLNANNTISVTVLQSKKGVPPSNFQNIDTVTPCSNLNISSTFGTYEKMEV